MRLWSMLASVLMLGLASCQAARAQAKLSPDFVLGPDDVIEVTVPNHEGLNKTLRVLPDGKIAYPEVGELKAAGKTPKAVGDEIQTQLLTKYNNVQVYVTVQEIHSQRVRIFGAVRLPVPGTSSGPSLAGMSAPPLSFDLKPGWRLVDLISVAGGLTVKPKMIDGRIFRSSGVLKLNVEDAMARLDGPSNVLLEPDDLVILEAKDPAYNMVTVTGCVARPGSFELQDGLDVIKLLNLAGSYTPEAALRNAYILRKTEKMPLNLYDTLVQGKADAAVVGFALQPGDVLSIPKVEEQYLVMGMVRQPGMYPFRQDIENTVLTALATAGGQTPEGDLRRAGLLRADRPGGQWQVTPLNLDDLMRKGKGALNFAMKPGDVIFVPARHKGFSWGEVISTITSIGYLGFRPF